MKYEPLCTIISLNAVDQYNSSSYTTMKKHIEISYYLLCNIANRNLQNSLVGRSHNKIYEHRIH